MLYRKMKKTGDELSILGFGCMRMPQKSGPLGTGPIDYDTAIDQLRHAIEKGVNYVDTGWDYHMGDSEPFVGRALSDGYRERVKIATKMPHWKVKTREDMNRILNLQLKKLKTDRIDYYLIHNVHLSSWQRLSELGIADFAKQAKKEGKIVHFGFSSHAPLDEFKAIIDDFDWEICQIQYNYMDEDYQAGTEGLEYAAAKGIGVVVMSPLRGGSLSGTLPKKIQDIWDTAETKRSPAEWALRWVWNRPEITVVLSGMNDDAQINENINIASEAHPESLTTNELETVQKVASTYRDLMKIPCNTCNYCMPCQSDVNIPLSFDLYNRLHMFGDHMAFIMYFGWMTGTVDNQPSLASQCTECGECVSQCPQQLDIPKLLEEVAGTFEIGNFAKTIIIIRHILKMYSTICMRGIKRLLPTRKNERLRN